MNTDQIHSDHPERDEAERRPFGFWLKVVDRRLSEEMERLYAADGIHRSDWRMLNLLADRADDERLARRLHAKPHVLHRLVERGWVAGFPPAITDAGRAARDRLESSVDGLRERIAGAVSPDQFATTLRSLEAIARELGWDESQPLPRGRRGGRRFGERPHEHHEGEPFGRRRRFGHGFEPREHFGGRGDFGPGFGPRRHGGHHAPRQDVHVHVHVHDDRAGSGDTAE